MLSNSVIRFTFIFLLILLNIVNINAQIKVAVLNFENTSNIEKYDGFGKAMSNMILTDLKTIFIQERFLFWKDLNSTKF